MLVTFTLEGLPPTINHFYNLGRSYVFKDHKARSWQDYTINLMRSQWDGNIPLALPLELHITFETNNRRKWDIDNRIKPIQDCLERAGIIQNDRLIETLHVQRLYGTDNKTILTLSELSHEKR